ncbi:MAG TPA: D-2-hydroxyacid dehydrogenase [Candidatus Pygmaiobacter gallistercoris]|nr:D-2-hydroxyacid dehydrogenase [Candidatus Pygmaiobacter gallistercoris]
MQDNTVVLNAARVNYDGKAGFEQVASQVTVYDETPPEKMLERVAGHTVVVTKEIPVPGEILRAFPDSVRLICEAGTGYNNIDLEAAREKGIAVCNVPEYSTQRVAQTVMLLMLNLASSMTIQQRMLAAGDHSNFTDHLKVDHIELNGKTLGVVGAGHIGRAVIRIAQAMEMKILATAHHPRPDEEGIHYVPLEELLRQSDFVSLHCPLTDETRHMIGAEQLGWMKPTAFLINTARGALIDEPALIAALQRGQIAGAGLDVQETEPPAADSPLYRMENVVLTPHMGWRGLETRRRLVSMVAENIRAFCSGSPINRIV